MPKITVIKKFTLTRDDHTQQVFEPGEYEVDDATAKHWYVQVHGPNPPKGGQASPFGPQVVKPIGEVTAGQVQATQAANTAANQQKAQEAIQSEGDDEQKRKAEEERAKGGKK